MLAFSSRKRGGGSGEQPLRYLDANAALPNAPAGSNLLQPNPYVVRPLIGGSKGGFIPSVMQGVVEGGVYLAPLAAITARKMLTNGGGKKEDWARNREFAKAELAKYGKPSAINVNKLAALARKNSVAAAAFMSDYRAKKVAAVEKAKTKKARAKGTKGKTKKNNGLGAMPRPFPMALAKPTHLYFDNEGRVISRAAPPSPPKARTPKAKTVKKVRIVSPNRSLKNREFPMTQASIRKQAEDNSKKAMAAYYKSIGMRKPRSNIGKKRTATRKVNSPPKTAIMASQKQSEWKTLMANAKTNLSQYGKPSGPNLTRYASMRRQGKNTSEFLRNFQTRKGTIQTKVRSPEVVLQQEQPLTAVSDKMDRYRHNYQGAKAVLSQIGRPTAANIAKFVSLKRRGESDQQFMANFRTRRTLAKATAAKRE